ncbi:MAG: mechanosensitive ion channel, partial [Arcobacteraceae bacterium]|nr:mechanosensitive ion channel [Arcobacteraceae bacterium]
MNISIEQISIAIGIFLLFLLFRKLFTTLIVKIATVFVKKTKSKFDDNLLIIITEPIKFAFIIIGLYISLNYLGLITPFVDNIFKSFSTFILFWIAYDIVIVLEGTFEIFAKKFGAELHKEIAQFLRKTIKIFIVVIGVVGILQIWNINVSAFLTSLGLGGLAFALAAKDTAANLFGGLTILADKSLKLGDWIKVDSVEGVVEEIGLRTTKVRTFEKSLITLPNQILANQPVEN